MKVASSLNGRPSIGEISKLFAAGSTVGPLVDSLHNQCLLEYHFAPIIIDNPLSTTLTFADRYLFASSWLVPPLLGLAYVVLGSVLPRLAQYLLDQVKSASAWDSVSPAVGDTSRSQWQEGFHASTLRKRAVLAVLSTALLIKASAILETAGTPYGKEILLALAILQWAWLDRSLASLGVAALASIAGPLAELPFVGHEAWTYLPQASDYFPLEHLDFGHGSLGRVAHYILGQDDEYQSLALASITGPCYFAVTMDAIACGRAFAGDHTAKDPSTS